MKQINYKSDFDFILRLQDCQGNDIGFPTYDFIAHLYTDSSFSPYIVSCKDGVCNNCCNDDGKLRIIVNNHHLGVGQLKVEFHAIMRNDAYPDGNKKVVTHMQLPIELIRGCSPCPCSFEAELIIPYAIIDAYDMAVSSGFKGTKEDFMKALNSVLDLASVANEVTDAKKILSDVLISWGVNLNEALSLSELIDKLLEKAATKNELDVVEKLAESVNQGLGETIERVTDLETSLSADKENLKNFKQHVEDDFVTDEVYNQDKEVLVGQIMSKQDSLKIVSASGTTLSAEVNKYYRFDSAVNSLAVTLPKITNSSYVSGVILNFTTGNTPAVTISASDDKEVSYFDGYEIAASTSYELNIMYNGQKWIVAYGVIE